jgi:hypothetical protein
MSDDLVKRLRVNRASLQMWLGEHLLEQYEKERTEAADRIEKLEAALRPFAKWADAYDPEENDDDIEAWDHAPTIGMLRAARKALEGKDG